MVNLHSICWTTGLTTTRLTIKLNDCNIREKHSIYTAEVTASYRVDLDSTETLFLSWKIEQFLLNKAHCVYCCNWNLKCIFCVILSVSLSVNLQYKYFIVNRPYLKVSIKSQLKNIYYMSNGFKIVCSECFMLYSHGKYKIIYNQRRSSFSPQIANKSLAPLCPLVL